MGGDVSGLRTATSGSLTDRLTREHRMTLDEARLILNVKKEDPAEKILQVRCIDMRLGFVLTHSAALRASIQNEFTASCTS